MTADLNRAYLLYEQARYDLAIQELGRALAQDPDDVSAHCLLALCFSKLKRHPDAIKEAQTAVALAPDISNTYYVLGSVLDDVGRFKEAEAAAREALRLDPEDADYYALASSIRLQQKQWADALTLADLGLSHDPDHVTCTNLKAMAQVNLGQREAARLTIGSALAKDPDNALTHANKGWADLHSGQHKSALEHFREALRLNPQMEWARQGLLEALRARNPVYRILLNYFLWTSRLGGQARWIVLIGINVIPRLVNGLTPAASPYRPLADIVVGCYVVFAFLTWTAQPLVNLLLRLDRFGRYALSPRQIIASNWVGSAFLLAVLGFIAWLVTQSFLSAIVAFGFDFVTAITSAAFSGSTPGVRRLIGSLTAFTALLLSGFLVYGLYAEAPWMAVLTALLLTALVSVNVIAQVRSSRRDSSGASWTERS